MYEAAEGTSRFSRLVDIKYHRQLMLGHDFDLREVAKLKADISALAECGDEPIVLRISSGGGEVEAAVVLRKAIQESRVPVYGLVVWQAVSAALHVLQACEIRLALSEAKLALHTNYSGVRITPDTHRLKAMIVAWKVAGMVRRNRQRIISDFCARIPALSKGEILHMMRKARIMSSEEALRLGFIDEIIHS